MSCTETVKSTDKSSKGCPSLSDVTRRRGGRLWVASDGAPVMTVVGPAASSHKRAESGGS